MKTFIQTIPFSHIVVTMLITCCLFSISSCKKKQDGNPAVDREKFIGTWHGSYSTNPTLNATFVISADTIGTGLTYKMTIGDGICLKELTLPMKVNGNTITCNFQAIQDYCENYFNLEGSGDINGSTLTWKQKKFHDFFYDYTFTGHK